AEARPKNNPATVAQLTENFAVGYKVMLLGQSQITIVSSADQAGYAMATGNRDTASFYAWQAYNSGGSPVDESLGLINDINGSDGLRAFVDQFRIFDPDTPLMLMRESVNGTSILDLTDDDDVSRAWSDLTDKTGKYGGDVTAVVVNWVTSNASPLEGNEGIDILQGFNTWTSEHSNTPDHSLADVLQPGYSFIVSPGTRHRYTSPDGYRNEAVLRANELGYTVGPSISDFEIDEGDSAHPNNAGQGNVRFGQRMAIALGRDLGLDASSNPYFAGTGVRSQDGTYVDIDVVLPNAGTLYSPAPNALSGFEVSEDAGSTWAETGFAAAINGADKVRLTRDTGTWAAIAQLQVRKRANLSGNVTILAAEEQPRIDGELYETWAPGILGLGLPVHGVQSGGQWTIPPAALVSQITQASAPSASDGFIAQANQISPGQTATYTGAIPGAGQFLVAVFSTSAQHTGVTASGSAAVRVGGTSVGLQSEWLDFWIVDTSAAGDVVLSYSAGPVISGISVWQVDSRTASGAIDAQSADVSSNTEATVTLPAIPPGSTVFAALGFAGGGTSGVAWGVLAEEHDTQIGSTSRHTAAALSGQSGSATVSPVSSPQPGGRKVLAAVALPPAP
ncbi:MAG: hypothetical protein KJN93_00335, partial [Alphaproteobacteria bacterium]|nr:hypothetical protein [Alphaproteobacteria bacterium]